MSASAVTEAQRETTRDRETELTHHRHLDTGLLVGIAVACAALTAGIAATGIGPAYFFQKTAALIVLGGTLGILFITTPRSVLLHALERVPGLISMTEGPTRQQLVEEIVGYARHLSGKGLLAIEAEIERATDPFLREALLLALDVRSRSELQSALESKIRLGERQSEIDAKVFEVAGSFAPTVGVLGTVVGLIDVLHQFTSLSAVAYGIGAAFTSTIYGLALANLLLLPVAHRIRSRAVETFDVREMMSEGALCLFDGVHPRLVRQRLQAFLRTIPSEDRGPSVAAAAVPEAAAQS